MYKDSIHHKNSHIKCGSINVIYTGDMSSQIILDNAKYFTFPMKASSILENFKLIGSKERTRVLENVAALLGLDTLTYNETTDKFNDSYLEALQMDIISLSGGTVQGIGVMTLAMNMGTFCERDEILVIKNPEAGLHAKSQSALGTFLVEHFIMTPFYRTNIPQQVFIDTWSEHIINGIRVSILRNNVQNNDVTIMFVCKNFLCKINIDDNGKLDTYPSGFMDQYEKNMLELLRCRAIN